MARVRLTTAAKAELDNALDWYEARSAKAAADFRQAIRTAVAEIGRNPRQFPPSRHGTRRALLRRFPYVVMFRQVDEDCVVVAIFHTSRDPQVWEGRKG